MSLLESVMEANKRFVRPNAFPPLKKSPSRQLAIFTCMDTRLVDFLEPAMGLKRGDAKVIKNAGNTIVDPMGGAVIRSLVVGIFLLGVEEVFVIGHRDCGMGAVDAEALKTSMISRGIEQKFIDEHIPDLGQWLGAFCHPIENVERVVQILNDNPLIPNDVPIHGLLFCPDDGQLEVIVNGYTRESFAASTHLKLEKEAAHVL